MSKISKADFIAGLKKSRLVDPKRLAELLENSEDDSPQTLAKNLIRQELATKWQAKYLLSGRSRLDIGNYRLLERIQRNEFGDRFLAVHTSLARKVDLQVLPGSLTKEKSNCDEFIQKASIAAKLDHPNLAHVYDIDQEGGRFFLVTEHVEGKALSESEHDSLTESQIARIICQAVEGIQYAHKHNVIHGCIGQSDLILNQNHEVKIQHLPLSPLRQQKSDSATTPTPVHDYAAIAKIGNELLSSSNSISTKQTDDLKAAFASLSIGSKEKIETATLALNKYIQVGADSNSEALPQIDGGFDQPIPSSTPFRKKKTTATEPAPEEPEFEEAIEPGYFGRLWRDNPVAVIATSVVTLLMLIGGSVFAGIQLAGGQGSQSTKLPNSVVKNDRENNTEKKTNAENDSPKLNAEPTRKNAPEIPTTEQMNSVLANIPAGNSNGFGKKNNNNKANAELDEAVAEKKPPIDQPAIDQNKAVNPLVNKGDNTKDITNVSANTNSADAKTPETMAQPEVHKDLRVVFGIGPATEGVLVAAEVDSLEKLAKLSPDEVRAALLKGGWQNTIDLDKCKGWIVQAKRIIGDETPMSTNTVAAGTPTSTNNSTPPPNVTGAFAKFPRIVGLPLTDDTSEIRIGDVTLLPSNLLGAKLICEEGFAKGKTVFELQKDSSNNQKWLVGLKKSEKHDPVFVAAFFKKEDTVYFNWLPEASTDKTAKKLAGYLNNCFLNLFSGNDSTFVTLREPVKFHDLRLTQASPFNEVEIAIPSMPAPETIVVQVLPMRVPDTETLVTISNIERNIPGVIWLKKNDKTGFLRIRITGEMRSKIRLRSDLVLILPNGQLQSVNSLATLSELKANLDRTAYQAQFIHDQFTKPPKMTKTDFDAKKKELLKDANAKQRVKDQINNYSEILPKLLNQPIKVQIFSKLGNMQTILATADPEVAQDSKK